MLCYAAEIEMAVIPCVTHHKFVNLTIDRDLSWSKGVSNKKIANFHPRPCGRKIIRPIGLFILFIQLPSRPVGIKEVIGYIHYIQVKRQPREKAIR